MSQKCPGKFCNNTLKTKIECDSGLCKICLGLDENVF